MAASDKMSAIEAFSLNGVKTRFEDFDARTVDLAKNRVIDVLGCVIGGANAPGNIEMLALIRKWAGLEESTLLVHGGKAPAQNVAMFNAIMARSFDFEVMSYVHEGKYLASHHAATLVPTALALGESRKVSGKEMLTAMLLGDDIAARVQAASAGHPIGLGWDGCGTLSHLGATATASRLLGLNQKQTHNAFGVVLNLIASAIQSIWDGATSFKLGQGTAARNGIFAAELAGAGWTGPDDALLSRFGYFFLYAGGCKDAEILTRDLGKIYYGEGYFKPFPSGMPTHQAIDAALALIKKHEIRTEDIQEIIIHVRPGDVGRSYYAKPFEIRDYPHGDAIFSYPYTVAAALLHKTLGPANFTLEAIQDPRIMALTKKTKFQDQPAGAMGIRVELKMKDGRDLIETGLPRDWLANPWPKDQILEKYWKQVGFSKTIGQKYAQMLLDTIQNIEQVGDVGQIVKLMV